MITEIILCIAFSLAMLSIAFAFAMHNLAKKHRLGDVSYVEYSRYKTEVIEEYECSKKSMEQLLKNIG
ncbi:MAG: hypothetical protein E7290_05220 [Lachnospiraceae bacterium]|nr:hypothetical protein [Lachnospiraceae bacterium]